MQQWYADNLDVAGLLQLWDRHILVQAVVRFFLIKLNVMEMNHIFGHALTEAGVSISAVTMKMPVLSAQVFLKFVIKCCISVSANFKLWQSWTGSVSIFSPGINSVSLGFIQCLIPSQECKSW